VFGPKPRSYAYSMPKKKYRAALQSALSAKVAESRLIVLSDLSLQEPKTKALAKTLGLLSGGAHALVIAGKDQPGVVQAARNLADVTVLSPDRLNVYDVVRAGVVVVSQRDLGHVQEVWS
jgi:large subunit ribosomal protein L4